MTHGLTGRARRPAPAGSFAAVDDAMLRNTAALVAWRTANLKTEPCGPDLVFVLGAAGDLLVANAVKDGFFEDKHVEGMGFEVKGSNGFSKNFPMTFTYWVTDAGVEFIKRYAAGQDIA